MTDDEHDIEDITEYSSVTAELVGDWASKITGHNLLAVNYVIIADCRGEGERNGTAVLRSSGAPSWMIHALLNEGHELVGEDANFAGENWLGMIGDDEDET